MISEIKTQLTEKILPFWESLKDDRNGGFYGYMDFDRQLNKEAEKGCILNSRITWFFANAYLTLGDQKLLDYAKAGYEFMKKACIDREFGGMLWSVSYDGKPLDTTKHTYNQAFSVYALSTYYDATKNPEALKYASDIWNIIETKCRDEGGYLEALDRSFHPVENDKLSENGVIASRTMNTLLHVLEAYTEFYRVTKRDDVKKRLIWILQTIAEKIYNPKLHRQEVFFDNDYNSLIDLTSYGHDIETAWLIDRTCDIIDDDGITKLMSPITKDLTRAVYEKAFDGHSIPNECEKGVVDEDRVWWIQAEGIVGFINGYQRDPAKTEYLAAAKAIWEYVKRYIIDPREGSEWFWLVDKDGKPYQDQPIVEPWKCPYHNGRMCMEVIRRNIDAK